MEKLLNELIEVAKSNSGKVYRGTILAALKTHNIQPTRNTDDNIRQELAKLGYSWEKCSWALSSSSTYWTITKKIKWKETFTFHIKDAIQGMLNQGLTTSQISEVLQDMGPNINPNNVRTMIEVYNLKHKPDQLDNWLIP